MQNDSSGRSSTTTVHTDILSGSVEENALRWAANCRIADDYAGDAGWTHVQWSLRFTPQMRFIASIQDVLRANGIYPSRLVKGDLG